jgi:hypothetical protein
LAAQTTVSHSASRPVVIAIPASPLNACRLQDVLCVTTKIGNGVGGVGQFRLLGNYRANLHFLSRLVL